MEQVQPYTEQELEAKGWSFDNVEVVDNSGLLFHNVFTPTTAMKKGTLVMCSFINRRATEVNNDTTITFVPRDVVFGLTAKDTEANVPVDVYVGAGEMDVTGVPGATTPARVLYLRMQLFNDTTGEYETSGLFMGDAQNINEIYLRLGVRSGTNTVRMLPDQQYYVCKENYYTGEVELVSYADPTNISNLVIALTSSGQFANALAGYAIFNTALAKNANFTKTLFQNTTFVMGMGMSTTLASSLMGNAKFSPILPTNNSFRNALINNVDFQNGLAAVANFGQKLAANASFYDALAVTEAFVTQLIQASRFIPILLDNDTFIEGLGANETFITAFADLAAINNYFINKLAGQNSAFTQALLDNFGFMNGIGANAAFIQSLADDASLDDYFLSAFAGNSDFTDKIVANTAFIDALVANEDFITKLKAKLGIV